MLTFLGLLAVAALILATGFFVAAEFAFVVARRGRLEDAASTGDVKAARAVEVHKRLSFMLSGAQLGITVTSLVVGFIAEPTLGRALEESASHGDIAADEHRLFARSLELSANAPASRSPKATGRRSPGSSSRRSGTSPVRATQSPFPV